MKRILLFDSNIEGHHADYLAHLINYWTENKLQGELLIATNNLFAEKYAQIEPQSWATNVKLISIDAAELAKLEKLAPMQRSFTEWNLVKKYIAEFNPTHLVLMYFDIFQLAIGLESKVGCEVSGIYFRPNFHYEISGFKHRLNQLLKKGMIQNALQKHFVKHLFSLDSSAVKYANSFKHGAKLLPISHPVKLYHISKDELTSARKFYKIPANKHVFLLFGFLDGRKGIAQLLDALKLMSAHELDKMVVLLVGPTPTGFKEEVQNYIASLNNSVEIITHFEEVRGRNIQTLFEISDYILALYQQHIGMSSVIVRAAVSQKPLLSSDYGFMGKMVKDNHLGAVVDSSSPEAIAQLLQKALLNQVSFSKENLRKVAFENSDIHFAETIFGIH